MTRGKSPVQSSKNILQSGLLVVTMLFAGMAYAQTDPGPRGGTAGAGGTLPGLTTNQSINFNNAKAVFAEVDSVKGQIAGEDGVGLGPTFNGNSCAQCHLEPSIGGSSPGLTIKGRTDAPGCNLAQPDFATQLSKNNVIFRIPTPLFGLGLVESTPDATFISNLAANAATKTSLGINGRLQFSGNDGTVSKFGWKAQNKSLMVFAGEAYNVEQGVSNDNFTNERGAVAGCVFNTSPEDKIDISTTGGSVAIADVMQFTIFMRLLAPPTPAPATTSINNGSALFDQVGCSQCHTRNLTSGTSPIAALNQVTYHPFSDFAIHKMGDRLDDGIHQADAEPDEFRTAPLWGLGQRLFFLHDGRTTDLLQAIAQHAGTGTNCFTNQDFDQFVINGKAFQPFEQRQTCSSEADAVVTNFNALTAAQKQDVLNFLRSL